MFNVQCIFHKNVQSRYNQLQTITTQRITPVVRTHVILSWHFTIYVLNFKPLNKIPTKSPLNSYYIAKANVLTVVRI